MATRTAAGGMLGRLADDAAVLVLLVAPWMVRPAMSQPGGCGMAAMSPHAPAGRHDGACSAACAVCAQLAPARELAATAFARAPMPVRYAELEVRASHVEPERATPPPR